MARTHFEINECLITLEFSQGIHSLNLIFNFYMWTPEIEKASSYSLFSSEFQAYWRKWMELLQIGSLLIFSHNGW